MLYVIMDKFHYIFNVHSSYPKYYFCFIQNFKMKSKKKKYLKLHVKASIAKGPIR